MRFFLGSLDDDSSGDDESGSEGEEQKTLKEVNPLPDNLKTHWVFKFLSTRLTFVWTNLSTRNVFQVVVAYKAAKKTRKKKEKFMKAKKLLSSNKKSKKENTGKFCNLLAIRYIYDPHTFAERLFGLLESKKNEKFETRLLCMALCARIIGIHKLQALSFYSYMHRFLQPKQREVRSLSLKPLWITLSKA